MSYAQTATDNETISQLQAVSSPTDSDKTQLCALLMRYGHDQETSSKLCDTITGWGYSPTTLMSECREIWLSGYRPGQTDNSIGSANDTDTDS